MPRYRKKPVGVEAWQVCSDDPMPECVVSVESDDENCIVTFSDGGQVHVVETDWLVFEGDDVEILAPRFFEQTYEVVE